MKKYIFFALCLVLLFSCSNNDEPLEVNSTYTDFPQSFEIPSQGGTFSLHQSRDNDYELINCTASVLGNKGIAPTYVNDVVQSHKIILVGENGEERTCVDQYYGSWFDIRKVNTQEISLTVEPNQTGAKRYIYLGVWAFYHKGMPTSISMEQASE